MFSGRGCSVQPALRGAHRDPELPSNQLGAVAGVSRPKEDSRPRADAARKLVRAHQPTHRSSRMELIDGLGRKQMHAVPLETLSPRCEAALRRWQCLQKKCRSAHDHCPFGRFWRIRIRLQSPAYFCVHNASSKPVWCATSARPDDAPCIGRAGELVLNERVAQLPAGSRTIKLIEMGVWCTIDESRGARHRPAEPAALQPRAAIDRGRLAVHAEPAPPGRLFRNTQTTAGACCDAWDDPLEEAGFIRLLTGLH
jgi:hypothetical protein